MKNRPNLIPLKRIEKLLAVEFRSQENIVHMCIVFTVIWNNRTPQYSFGFQRFQKLVITLPASEPLFGYAICLFKLRPKERSNEFPWQKG